MSEKAKWFVKLSKLPKDKREAVLKSGKGEFLKDLQKIIRVVGRSKKVKVIPTQHKLFKKHRYFLSKISNCKGAKKFNKLVSRKVSGGFFGILATLLPAIISAATHILPKILG